jgi:four helix bundle protein
MDVNDVYRLSMQFSQHVWELAAKWPYFVKSTMGNQIVRSADSVSANIREGQGRYFFKDRNRFNFFARGSLFETLCWLEKANARDLISMDDFELLKGMHDKLLLEINKIVKHTREQVAEIDRVARG